MQNIKRAKQEKKREGTGTTHVIDLESHDSTEAAAAALRTPPLRKSSDNARDAPGTSSAEKSSKKPRNASAERESTTSSIAYPPSPATAPSQPPAEFPPDTPPEEDLLEPVLPPARTPLTPLLAGAKSTAAATPLQAGTFKYVEVVRKKKEREKLPATECEQCKQVRVLVCKRLGCCCYLCMCVC